MSDSDSKDIVRRWNREIEDEIRREAARPGKDGPGKNGPWKVVTWAALWLLWLALLLGALTQLKALH